MATGGRAERGPAQAPAARASASAPGSRRRVARPAAGGGGGRQRRPEEVAGGGGRGRKGALAEGEREGLRWERESVGREGVKKEKNNCDTWAPLVVVDIE